MYLMTISIPVERLMSSILVLSLLTFFLKPLIPPKTSTGL